MGAFFSIFVPSWVENQSPQKRRVKRESRYEIESDESGIEDIDEYKSRRVKSVQNVQVGRYPRDGGGDSGNMYRNQSFNTSNSSCNRSFNSRKESRPEPFNGNKTDLKDWLLHFETCSRWNDWSYEEKGVNLAMCLRGSAQQILSELSPHEVEDFDRIKALLKRRFDPVEKETLRRIEFRARMKKRDETVSEFGYALNRLAACAYPDMPVGARETIIIDQFVNGLPSRDLRRHVQFNHPKTIHEAIALALEFESFDSRFEGRKPEEVGVRHVDSGTAKTIESEMKVVHDLIKALQAEREAMKRNEEERHRARPRGPVVCYNCGEQNHIAPQCPQPKTQNRNRFPRHSQPAGN